MSAGSKSFSDFFFFFVKPFLLNLYSIVSAPAGGLFLEPCQKVCSRNVKHILYVWIYKEGSLWSFKETAGVRTKQAAGSLRAGSSRRVVSRCSW